MEGSVCVVIAAFNEAEALQALLPAIPERVHGRRVVTIVVSDGSTDETALVARDLGADVVELPANRGKGAALRIGFARSRERGCEWVVAMDGDGQHAPADVYALLEPLATGEADVVLGSRYLAGPRRGSVPFNRYAVRRLTVAVLARLLGRTYTDPYCGYRALAMGALEPMSLVGDRYECELEMIFEASRLGLEVVEVPVARIYARGTSKMGARGGRLIGRIRVLTGYARTILQQARRLGESTTQHVPASGRGDG